MTTNSERQAMPVRVSGDCVFHVGDEAVNVKGDLFYLASEYDLLLSQVERMRPYLQHKSGCGQRYSSTAGEWVAGRDCTCGLTELLKDIK